MSGELQPLSSVDAAYVAGVIDGEGTIPLIRMHRGENRRPVVSISNTELPLLRYIRTVIGAGRITNKRAAAIHHTPSYAYVLTGRRAISLMRQVVPFLRTYKAARAQLILEHYVAVTPRNGRYSPALKAKRDEFERAFFAIRVRGVELTPPSAIPSSSW